MYYLGIDIGATNLKYGILDEDNNLIFDDTFKISLFHSRDSLLDYLINEIQILQTRFREFKTIGIGCPGMITEEGRIIESPNIPVFNNFDFKKEFERKSQRTIAFDNDANCAALAELVIGAGKDLENFVYITLGTGVGGTIIIDRKIYHGEHCSAGEIGHILINPFDEINSQHPYRTGVLEEYIGKEGIIRIARNLAQKYPDSSIVTQDKFDIPDISNMADKGEPLCVETMKITGNYLGLAITTIANLLDIPNFIIGGGISKSSDILYNEALHVAQMRSLPSIATHIKIIKAQFIEKTGVIGAALLGKLNEN
ncbi:MAG: ROK family protein [Chloroherpetonaceae bacterium]|nr:ROK family protein [bacterium]